MREAHTPGPWEYLIDSGSIVARIDDGRNWILASIQFAPTGSTFAANAHLISAAPDLLAACVDALEICQDLERANDSDYSRPGKEIIGQLRAAVAKASPRLT